jgi:hypothetical protein
MTIMEVTRGGFYKTIYSLRLKFTLYVHPFCINFLLKYDIIHLHLELNLLHFLPDKGALYALRRAPNFHEIHPSLTPQLPLPEKFPCD